VTITPIILAGGSGSRLWPLSRESFPKQFIKIIDDQSLFEKTLKRILKIQNENIHVNPPVIVTNEDHRFYCIDVLEKFVDKYHIILESSSRNTAPSLTLASLLVKEKYPDSTMIVLPADHLIADTENFIETIMSSCNHFDDDSIVVVAVPTESPDINFGYIKISKEIANTPFLTVDSFIEKPLSELAEIFFQSKDYFWNAGIFILKASLWLKCINILAPEISELVIKSWVKREEDSLFVRPNADYFDSLKSISIDYAVIEKCPNSIFNIKAIIMKAGWSDLGSWNAISKFLPVNADRNSLIGDTYVLNACDTTILSNYRTVAAIGTNNLIIIETSDAVLVVNKENTSDIRLLTQEILKNKSYLLKLHRKSFRPWGWFDILESDHFFKVKRLFIKPKNSLSLQSHKHRAEHWVVISGRASIIIGKKTIQLKENESIYISKNEIHRLANDTNLPLEIIEVQTGEYLGEDDIKRYSDIYGRSTI